VNPGFPPQVPNEALSGGTPRANSSLQAGREGSSGLEFGWLGLLGMAGLLGFRKNQTE
jgi:MYXO-CTERM domain-containing protein